MDGHHLFPKSKEFYQRFRKLGIEPHDYIIDLEPDFHRKTLHAGKGCGSGGRWNKEWRDFFKRPGKRTANEAWEFAEDMIRKHLL